MKSEIENLKYPHMISVIISEQEATSRSLYLIKLECIFSFFSA